MRDGGAAAQAGPADGGGVAEEIPDEVPDEIPDESYANTATEGTDAGPNGRGNDTDAETSAAADDDDDFEDDDEEDDGDDGKDAATAASAPTAAPSAAPSSSAPAPRSEPERAVSFNDLAGPHAGPPPAAEPPAEPPAAEAAAAAAEQPEHPPLSKSRSSSLQGSNFVRGARLVGYLSRQLSMSRSVTNMRDEERKLHSELVELQQAVEGRLEESKSLADLKRNLMDYVDHSLSILNDPQPKSEGESRASLEAALVSLKDGMVNESRSTSAMDTVLQGIVTKIDQVAKLIQQESILRSKQVDAKGNIEETLDRTRKELDFQTNARQEFENLSYKLDTQVQVLTDLRNRESKERARLLDSRAQAEAELDRLKMNLDEEFKVNKELESLVEELKNEKYQLTARVKELTNQLETEKIKSEDAQVTKSELETQVALLTEEAHRLSQALHEEHQGRMALESAHRRVAKENDELKERVKALSVHKMFLAGGPRDGKGGGGGGGTRRRGGPHPPRGRPATAGGNLDNTRGSRASISSIQSLGKATQRAAGIADTIKPVWCFGVRDGRPRQMRLSLFEADSKWFASYYGSLANRKPQHYDVMSLIVSRNEEAVRAMREGKYLRAISDMESSIQQRLRIWDAAAVEVQDPLSQLVVACNEFAIKYMAAGAFDSALKLLKRAETLCAQHKLPSGEQLQYDTYNNLAYYFHSRTKPTAGLQFLQKASRLPLVNRNQLRQLEMQLRLAYSFSCLKSRSSVLHHLKIAQQLVEGEKGEEEAVMGDNEERPPGVVIDRAIPLAEAKVLLFHNLAVEQIYVGMIDAVRMSCEKALAATGMSDSSDAVWHARFENLIAACDKLEDAGADRGYAPSGRSTPSDAESLPPIES